MPACLRLVLALAVLYPLTGCDSLDSEPVQIVIARDARTHVHPAIREGFVFVREADAEETTR